MNFVLGNGTLADLSPKSLRRRYLCSKHFSAEQIKPKKLPTDAIPDKYSSDTSSGESEVVGSFEPAAVSTTYGIARKKLFQKKQSESESSDETYLKELQNLPMTQNKEKKHGSLKKENQILKRKLEIVRKKNNNLQTQLNNARKKILKLNLSTKMLFNDTCITKFSKCLMNMQVQHQLRRPWTATEKQTALSIYYKSPSAYNYLRKKGVILPAVSSIKKWLGNFVCWPGFNKRIFKHLRMKVETMKPSEKICILMFDEMSLKKHFDYNERFDWIEGVADLGSLGRRPVPANQALVMMIRGIYSSWKFPVTYVVTENGVSAQELKDILLTCLEELLGIKLNPIGVVCDASTVNQKLFKKLSVTIEHPYFFYNEKKYWAFYDVPHLLKCVRNNFLNSHFLYKERTIQFLDIKKVYEIDSNSKTGRCLLKLTEKHLYPNAFEKMSVKLAAQLLSNSTAAALKVAVRSGELSSITAENTAYFVETMNNLFDALNSTQFRSVNPYNRVLSEKNPQVLLALNAGYDLLENLYKIDKKGDLHKPPSFNGFLQTINAVKMFFEEQKEDGYSFLFTGRLIQDPLENQFSIYRQKGGYNRNPTVKSFRASFKINLVTNLIKPSQNANSGTNIDSDESILTFDDQEAASLALLNKDDHEENLEEASDYETSDSSNFNFAKIQMKTKKISLENCSRTYFAGYLVKKLQKKFSCHQCKEILEVPQNLQNEDELLIFYKNFNGLEKENALKTPSNIMKVFTEICMDEFSRNIQKFLAKKIYKNLEKIINKYLSNNLPDWWNVDENCREHRMYVMKLLLRTLIHKYCKTTSKSIKTRSLKKNVKLSILKNE